MRKAVMEDTKGIMEIIKETIGEMSLQGKKKPFYAYERILNRDK